MNLLKLINDYNENLFKKFTLTLIVCLIIIKLFNKYLIWSKLPTGPIGLPILGYVLYLGKRPYIAINELAKEYGSVFR